MPNGSVDRRPDTVFLGHVRRDRDAIPAGLGHDLRGLLARLSVDFGDKGVSIEVTNSAGEAGIAREPGGGHGLAGMRERAAAIGGQLEAGPQPDGGFRVKAVLPLAGSAG